MSDEAGSGYLRGVITGLLFGAAAALLLAPKPGGELRHHLAEGASKLKDKAGSLGGSVADTVADAARDLKQRGSHPAPDSGTGNGDALADAADYAEAVREEDQGEAHDVVKAYNTKRVVQSGWLQASGGKCSCWQVLAPEETLGLRTSYFSQTSNRGSGLLNHLGW